MSLRRDDVHAHTEAAGSGLGDLLARVEGATGDNEAYDRIGYDVAVALIGRDEGHAFLYPFGGSQNSARSLDAALALVERVLPGWTWDIGSEGVGDGFLYSAIFWSPDHQFDTGECVRPTPALALLAAMLRALASAEGEAKAAQVVASDPGGTMSSSKKGE